MKRLTSSICIDMPVGSYAILQLREGCEFQFSNMKAWEAAGRYPNVNDYEVCYLSKLGPAFQNEDDTVLLDELFAKFNTCIPDDFFGHSLSVSDSIVLNRYGLTKIYFVDSFGFMPIEFTTFFDEIGFNRKLFMQYYFEEIVQYSQIKAEMLESILIFCRKCCNDNTREFLDLISDNVPEVKEGEIYAFLPVDGAVEKRRKSDFDFQAYCTKAKEWIKKNQVQM